MTSWLPTPAAALTVPGVTPEDSPAPESDAPSPGSTGTSPASVENPPADEQAGSHPVAPPAPPPGGAAGRPPPASGQSGGPAPHAPEPPGTPNQANRPTNAGKPTRPGPPAGGGQPQGTGRPESPAVRNPREHGEPGRPPNAGQGHTRTRTNSIASSGPPTRKVSHQSNRTQALGLLGLNLEYDE